MKKVILSIVLGVGIVVMLGVLLVLFIPRSSPFWQQMLPRGRQEIQVPAESTREEEQDLSSEEEREPSQSSSQPPQEDASEQEDTKEGVESSSSASEEEPDPDAWELILVSAQHPLTAEYEVELQPIEGFADFLFDKRAVESLEKMISCAKEQGVDLVVISTYRSFERSEKNYNAKVEELQGYGYSLEDAQREAARWIARPGESEHNTGLAIDIVSQEYFDDYGGYLNTPFEEYEGFRWLYENCAQFGFVLRYPKDKEDVTGIHYEPWHYRYVGVENAERIMSEKITLEEYLE